MPTVLPESGVRIARVPRLWGAGGVINRCVGEVSDHNSQQATERGRQMFLVRIARGVMVMLLPVVGTIVFCASAQAVAKPHAPGAYTGGASILSPSSVVLHGTVTANGQLTSYVFQYGTTTAYGGQTAPASAGHGTATIKVSVAVGGLQPYTIYHYRVLATSVGGTTAGKEGTFKTGKAPLSLQIAGVPNPVLYDNPFSVQGTLSGTGAAGRVVALQINPFPYLSGFKTYGNPELTNSAGSFSFPVLGLLENAQLRVVTTAPPYVTSPVVPEGVAVRVTLHARRVQRHRRGHFYSLYGTITPAEVGASVGIQWIRPGAPSVNRGGAFSTLGTNTSSRFRTVVHVRHRGLYEALVVVKDGSHVSSYSAPVLLR
jgi:hypothetical protein